VLYSPKKVAAATETSDRNLIYLAERSIIDVAVEAQGRGTSRQYSKFNVFQIVLVNTLRRAGIEFGKIKIFLEEHGKRIWELMRSDDGEYVITVGDAGEIRIGLGRLRENFDLAMGRLE